MTQVTEGALSGGDSAGGGEKWPDPGYFFPKENKKDSCSVVVYERKGNGRIELLLRLEGHGAEVEKSLTLDLRFLLEELGEGRLEVGRAGLEVRHGGLSGYI